MMPPLGKWKSLSITKNLNPAHHMPTNHVHLMPRFFSVSPMDIRPLPKAGPGKSKKRKSLKSAILTSTPIKENIRIEEMKRLAQLAPVYPTPSGARRTSQKPDVYQIWYTAAVVKDRVYPMWYTSS
ncbi:hypothetical protein J6590_044129 [Homalodisca vitripennis]|nr:hypothetical protein J6590_044129 [Homalodisca vitripennis]